MSKGPGKRQASILKALDDMEYIWLCDLLPAHFSPAEYSSLYRAACTLESAGRIIIRKYTYGRNKLLLCRLYTKHPEGRPMLMREHN